REVRVLERRPCILIAAAPQEPRREAAPQRRIAEETAPAAVESRLVRGRSGRTDALQLERDLGSHALDLLVRVRQIVVDRRGGRERHEREQKRRGRRAEPRQGGRPPVYRTGFR